MTQSTRRTIDAALNTNIALKGLQRHATEANLTQRYQLHPEQRKQQLLEPVARTFESGSGKYGAAIMETAGRRHCSLLGLVRSSATAATRR
ncbi:MULTISPECIES: hypothetical protein [Bradyrhizobium]|uniref:hypothetical protein n=1 Tax=Bradyrhizobium TaxID=374 RepID=UPI000D641E64|nr:MULTISPECIES: hypothetical protein [Bradyrhizobium]MCA1414400.1 hypothetical protein [Bradyrhizobium sp. NBAIM20]MCA1465656.1 hypothetical protein [Bradyrhizobium sp. NBAIM18]MCA1530401.1 hypothetical protein [Bradyrhizobium yuanmingense]PWE75451.1 hypothetical protein XF30_00490 [Bradyrhizobium sp. SUTN9-2]